MSEDEISSPTDGATRSIAKPQPDSASSWSRGNVTPPTVRAVARIARQFERLEKALESPAIWLHGPPGAGKTTLVANWLAWRRHNPTWIRLDVEDSEPATLFFHLGIAEAVARGDQKSRLAVLTPAFQHDVRAFSRRFFGGLFARRSQPIVVIDDYHELDWNSPAHECLALGVNEIAPGAHLIVISRTPPPKAFARAQVNGALDVISPETLQVDAVDALEIAHSRGLTLDPKQVGNLTQAAQGWVAGLILMMEARHRGAARAPEITPKTPELLFDYFASEVMQKLEHDERRNLMVLSLMPSVTANAAEALTGDAQAGALLERLAWRNDFTARDAGLDGDYRFHHLFREYLAEMLRRECDPDESRRVRLLAAQALEQGGQPDAAAVRLREAEAWGELIALINRWARKLESAGRLKTLAAWVEMLPPACLERNGWMNYWAATAAAPFAAPASRPLFRRAYEAFQLDGDVSGVFLAGSGLLDALASDHLANRDELRAAIASLRDYMRGAPEIPTAPIEFKFAVSIYGALNQTSADRAEIAGWRQRMIAAADRIGDAGAIGLARLMVVLHAAVDGDYASVRERIDAMPAPELLAPWPELQTLCYLGLIVAQSHRQAPGSVVETAKSALEMAEHTGVRGYSFIFATYAAGDCLRKGKLAEAEAWVAQIGENMDRMSSQRAAYYYYCACGLHTLAGHLPLAVTNGETAVRLAVTSAYRYLEALSRLALAQAYLAIGDLDALHAELSSCAAALEASASNSLRFPLALLKAEFVDRRENREAGLAALRAAMALGERMGSRRTYLSPPLAPRLLARALAHGVASEFAHTLILNDELEPPECRIAEWPWPLKIVTLGGFQLFMHGKPFLASRKIPRRLFTLVKALTAFGGKDVAQDRLIDSVWPEEDGDAARQSFDTAVFRLRKLFGDNQVVLVKNGRVGFNPARCWIDIWAFEEGVSVGAEGDENFLKSLRLYSGDFLRGENELYWIEPRRRTLRTTFLGAVDYLAKTHLALAEWESAAQVYRMGVEACADEPAPYQGLIDCCHKLGRADEAALLQNKLRAAQAGRSVSPLSDKEGTASRGDSGQRGEVG